MSFITSLISVGVYWIFKPLFSLLLYLDGVVYSLVAYSYKVFMLMAQLNFNVVYAWISPLIDRINAIIMVLIMFKLGYSLIQYMIDPEKIANKTTGGAALIKNIAICAALLISYSFVFSVMNELSMLVIGVPKGYEFTTLKQLADVTTNDGANSDSGLISRFIFGTQANDVGDFGMYLATTTLQVFLHGKDNNQSSLAEQIYSDQLNKSKNGNINTFDLTKITDVVSELDKTVEYKYPIISTAMAIYLIWSVIKLSIEVGVRMFKLIVLQIMAPVAIVSIIDKGLEAKPWKKFIDTYWKTWLDAFIRVGSLFLVTAFISKFWTDRSALFPDVDGFTRYIVLLIVIFAAYRFAQLLPKFIDEILGHSLSENNAKGFGGVLGGIAGFGVGALGGLATGVAAKNGLGGILANGIGGAFGGAAAGSKGKNVADFFKGQNGNIQKRANVAVENAQWKDRGGVAGRLANKFAGATGMTAIHDMHVGNELKKENKAFEAEQKAYDTKQSGYNAEMSENSSRVAELTDALTAESRASFANDYMSSNLGSALSADSDYSTYSANAERLRGELANNNFSDIVDSNGTTITADYQRQMTENSLRMAEEKKAEARERVRKDVEQKGEEAWTKREQSIVEERRKILQRQSELTRKKNESTEAFQKKQDDHKDKTDKLDKKKWGK